MARTDRPTPSRSADARWYVLPAEQVTQALGVDPDRGLSSERAAQLLRDHGPNALPRRQPRRCGGGSSTSTAATCRSSCVGAAVVSLLIQEWSTAVLLVVLTVVNAVVGLRQEGKAESAMNALKSMMKVTARVRRDGAEAEIPAEELVVGDVVLLAAGRPGARRRPHHRGQRRCRSTSPP